MLKIALVGATGNVGRNIISIIEERGLLEKFDITPVGSKKSARSKVSIGTAEVVVQSVEDSDFKNFSIVIFATRASVSEKLAPIAASVGCIVIDCSSCFRMDPKIPLVIPPVNIDDVLLYKQKNIVAMANCVASPLATVLKPLEKIALIKRVVISTYQSVSGAGKRAMDELFNQSKASFTSTPYVREVFDKDIAFNVIPTIDVVMPSGVTGEEGKIAMELKRVLSSDLSIAITSVRVPVFVGHCASVAVEFESELSLKTAQDILRSRPHIKLVEGYDNNITPQEVVGEDDVYVSRLRSDFSVDYGLLFWVASDNLRRGSALDAVETLVKMESLLRKK